ncbi:MAG: CARDB domain-containing protein, partial [Salibacteraceae bacterium]
MIWLGPAGHLLAQNWVPGNPFVDSIPVVSSCSLAPAILVPNSGNPTGTVSQNPLKFVFSNVASNADRYRIQINAGNSIAGWDSLNGFGFEGAKPNTLYEFTDNLNNASDVVRNIPVASLNGPGDYYITARQLIPGNAPNPCMGQAFGPSEYTTPQHFNIPKPNLVLGPTGFQCFISGTIATCSLRVVNDGFFDVNTFKVGFYISADTILTGSNPDFRYQVINIDTGTFGSGIAGGLAAGDTTAWLMSTIDLATITARAPGEYNLGVIIDYTAVVMESNETDNNHLIVGQTAQVPVNTLEADLATPVDGLIIDRNNTGTYIDTAGDLRITGTANAANVADIRVFSNGVQVSTVSQPVTNPWADTISVVAGTNDLYVNVVCNYSFCSSSGVNSATRSITYMKPLGPSAVVADDLNGTLTVNWQKHTEPGTANFRYRVYRNTLPVPDSGSEWVALSNWTNGSQLIDTVPQRGIAYYYWVVCAR